MKFKNLLALILGLLPMWLLGQELPKERVYQMSGMILTQENDSSIAYAKVQINHSRQGTLTNAEGFYSIPVREQDTLYFTHLGHHPGRLIIRDYLRQYKTTSQYLYSVTYLRRDTLTLPIVKIFPYDTPEELKTAVVNMDILHDSPEAIARQNLDPDVIHAIIQTLPKDGEERLMVARQMYYDYYQNRNLMPGVGLDAVAAMRLLQHIVQKSKKRKNKDLNYWE